MTKLWAAGLKIAKRQAALFIDGRCSSVRVPGSYVVGGMATMPSRAETFERAFLSAIRQVDKLYLYLDGHVAVPDIAKGDARVTPILSKEVPGLHGNGKYYGLSSETRPCVYVGFDDDIYYRRDYVSRLTLALREYNERAVVGLHGTIFAQPFERYLKNRTLIYFQNSLDIHHEVDTIGSGTAAFCSDVMDFDVREWLYTNTVDLSLSAEARKRMLPIICIARPPGTATALASEQSDSVFQALRRDDTIQNQLARELIALRRANSIRSRTRAS